MDNQQRRALARLLKKLDELHVNVGDVRSEIQDNADDEREKYDNMSEARQASETGQSTEAMASALEEAAGEIEQAQNSLTNALDKLAEMLIGE